MSLCSSVEWKNSNWVIITRFHSKEFLLKYSSNFENISKYSIDSFEMRLEKLPLGYWTLWNLSRFTSQFCHVDSNGACNKSLTTFKISLWIRWIRQHIKFSFFETTYSYLRIISSLCKFNLRFVATTKVQFVFCKSYQWQR